jgi:glycosyltransferase involved in cell wall biosynthesis
MNRGYRPEQGPKKNEAPAIKEQRQAKVIAAIPCFNEERFIGSVVLKTKGYVDEVMVIDDGSTDRTALVAEKAGATVIRHDSNQGKAAAVSTAFEQAREMGCRALVLLDGDGQHEPADIPSLLQPVLEGKADMVVGSRFLRIKSHIPRVRALGQRILTFFTNLGSRVRLTDSQSGFRAFSPKAIEALSFAEKGLSVESEMQFLAKDANLRVVEVPVGVVYYGMAKRSFLAHGMWVFNSIMGLISRRLPLFFFGVPGAIMLAVGLWQGARVVQGYGSTGDFWIGPALLAVLLCTVGILSLFTGLILYTIRSFFK